MVPWRSRVAQNPQQNYSRPGKRRFDEINSSIENLRHELRHYDQLLKTELEQRVFCDYDRALLEAELYKERLVVLTQSSKSQIGLVQMGAALLSWDRRAGNSPGYNNDSNSKRKKLNHGEGDYYNQPNQSNYHQHNYNNNSYNQPNYYKNSYNQDNYNQYGPVNPWTTYNYQNTVNNRYYAPRQPYNNKPKNGSHKAAKNKYVTANSRPIPAVNQINSAVKTSFSTSINPNAFKSTTTAAKSTVSAVKHSSATASAVKPTVAVTAVPATGKPAQFPVTVAVKPVAPVKASSIPLKTNSINTSASKPMASSSKSSHTINNVVNKNACVAKNSISVVNGNVTKKTSVGKTTSIPVKIVANRSISYEDAVKVFTAKSNTANTTLSMVKERTVLKKDGVPPPKIMVKDEPGTQNNNVPSLFSLNLSPIMKLRFADSDGISFKTERSMLPVQLFSASDIKNEPMNGDFMEDDLADHI